MKNNNTESSNPMFPVGAPFPERISSLARLGRMNRAARTPSYTKTASDSQFVQFSAVSILKNGLVNLDETIPPKFGLNARWVGVKADMATDFDVIDARAASQMWLILIEVLPFTIKVMAPRAQE